MADPASYRPSPGEIPKAPGVYRFLDPTGRVIYVGKAKNLAARLANYFQDPAGLHPRTRRMVFTACAVKWVVVASEVEALSLEYAWIKEFAPRFNVMYRDDKSYPYLALTMREKFPRMHITRERKRASTRYFGPYTKVWAIRDTVDLLLRVFPVRTCTNGVFARAHAQGRPCLLGYIDKCSAPCVGKITEEAHRDLANQVGDFLAGKTAPFERKLEADMREAAARLDFEAAAKLRDDLAALRTVNEKNTVVFNDGTDADVFALVADELEAAVQVFHVRGGRIRGERGWVVERVDDSGPGDLMARLLQQVYGDIPEAQRPLRGTRRAARDDARSVDDVVHTATDQVPRDILVSAMPADAAALEQWLGRLRGAGVSIRVPQRGAKRALMETVTANAHDTLRLHKSRRSGDLTQRSQALEELQEALGLASAPLRIECYDISHTQGTHQVGSLVVFEDGAPRKSAYRHFTVRGERGEGASDDTAAMAEVLTRRFRRLQAEEAGEEGIDEDGVALRSGPLDEATGKPRRFSYRPDLVVVDGGLPQVNAARATLTEMGVDIAVIGLAKRLEEVWVADDDYPVILPRTSAALYMLQHVRDEAHRFAITAHRKKRARAMTRSLLDEVDGLGPARQQALLRAFGSVAKMRRADVGELAKTPGIGPRLAENLYELLHRDDASGGAKAATTAQ
ncbi:excinuclease ABC subunit UvrC [Nanchangia anserum]|uniref:UvrABC system protein C n=1 Tax=Nanchangia anserum TaxID=2692125 RepID=A0A8I0KPB3_9ACTO|nr:excinuclease ABC subunit UvrC [Nanchangia anserum]MBD3688715.1 excinuclease ABC subunit UvrC [Nanchangia anserum]QOX82462.1 excinuclease ABC subunit UvrC [Nanchangia anserum]